MGKQNEEDWKKYQKPMVIEIGDQIRFSVDLLLKIKADDLSGSSQVVQVVKIDDDEERGLKTMVLGNIRSQDPA